MGTEMCSKCSECGKESEISLSKPVDRDQYGVVAEYIASQRRNSASFLQCSERNSEMSQQFAKLVHGQCEFGSSSKVRSVEKRYGNFPFDDQAVNDGVAKIVVGPVELEFGAQYYGHLNPNKNERHGFGMQIWGDGTKYVGYWREDRIEGRGRMISRDGDVYTGEWKTNAAHGVGEYEDAAGMRYSGEWAKDRQEGRGKDG